MNQREPIDLVLPVYNPQKGWAQQCVAHYHAFREICGRPVQLIVVDDGSDESEELNQIITDIAGIKLVRNHTNKGKGHALRLGMKESSAPMVLFTDADFPYDMDSMLKVVKTLDEGAEVALGHRKSEYYASVPWFRKGMSELFRFVLKALLNFPITDTQCGLKGMNASGRAVFLNTRIDRFLVDMEFIKLAVRANCQIEAVVVQLRANVEFSKMGLGVILRELINFIRVVFR